MSDGADSDRDLPRAAGDDEPRHPLPRAAKEEEPPVADEFQDAPPSPETNSDGDGERRAEALELVDDGGEGGLGAHHLLLLLIKPLADAAASSST